LVLASALSTAAIFAVGLKKKLFSTKQQVQVFNHSDRIFNKTKNKIVGNSL